MTRVSGIRGWKRWAGFCVASQPGFPGSVYGFGFRMPPGDMAQLCLSKAGTWKKGGTTASCKPKLESGVTPEIQISFELGAPSEIRTLYIGNVETRNRDYPGARRGLTQRPMARRKWKLPRSVRSA